jgi:hypothetical protein
LTLTLKGILCGAAPSLGRVQPEQSRKKNDRSFFIIDRGRFAERRAPGDSAQAGPLPTIWSVNPGKSGPCPAGRAITVNSNTEGVSRMNRLKFSLAAAAALAAGSVAAQTVLTVSTWLPPTHGMSMAQKEWCDLLEKTSTGKMKCNILPRGVANPPGTYDAIKTGLADVSFTVTGYTPGRFVYTQMAEFPFLGNSSEPI